MSLPPLSRRPPGIMLAIPTAQSRAWPDAHDLAVSIAPVTAEIAPSAGASACSGGMIEHAIAAIPVTVEIVPAWSYTNFPAAVTGAETACQTLPQFGHIPFASTAVIGALSA